MGLRSPNSLFVSQVDSRGCDDDFSIDQFLIELGVLTLLIGGSDQSVALILEPFPDSKLILGRT